MFCVKKWNQSYTRILNRPFAHDKIKKIAIFSTTLNENWTSVLCINEIYSLHNINVCFTTSFYAILNIYYMFIVKV